VERGPGFVHRVPPASNHHGTPARLLSCACDYWRFPLDAAAAIGDPEAIDERYSGSMTLVLLSGIEEMFPGTTVLDERFAGDGAHRAYCCVLEIPGGSTLNRSL